MLNPECPRCGSLLVLERAGGIIWDWVPAAPPLLRRYLTDEGPAAPVWYCTDCVELPYWSPVR